MIDEELGMSSHWEDKNRYTAMCSNCGYYINYDDKYNFKYCPKCGLKMNEGYENLEVHPPVHLKVQIGKLEKLDDIDIYSNINDPLNIYK